MRKQITLNNIKGFFNRKKSEVLSLINKFSVKSYFNNTSNVVFLAGKSCYKGNTTDMSYENIYKFINERIKVGHESIIEHTNFIVSFQISEKYYAELIELLSCCRYLNVRTKNILNNKNTYILVNIAGSIRGYKHVYNTIENLSNRLLIAITQEIYTHVPSVYFRDFIDSGLFDESNFLYIDEEENIKNQDYSINDLDFKIPNDQENKIKLIHIDTIDDLKKSGIDFINQSYWIQDILTITVKFNGLARYSTHQLVRHRNGVTQESQRYVDYSNNPINNPVIYNTEYDPDKKYKLASNEFATYKEDGMTADELCQLLQPIYKQLKDQGMKPEEARGFTPFATKSGDLYMTFTYRTLAKFFDLRLDSHAQGEIRRWAEILFEYITNIPELSDYFVKNVDGEDVLSTLLLEPTYKQIEDDNTNDPYTNIDEEI